MYLHGIQNKFATNPQQTEVVEFGLNTRLYATNDSRICLNMELSLPLHFSYTVVHKKQMITLPMLTDFHNFSPLERKLDFQQNPCNISDQGMCTLSHCDPFAEYKTEVTITRSLAVADRPMLMN